MEEKRESASHEAAVLAWTDMVIDGAVWNITIREGATPDKLQELFLNIKAVKPIAEQIFGEDNVYIVGKNSGGYIPQPQSNLPSRNLDDDMPEPERKQAKPNTQPQAATGDGVYHTTVTNVDGKEFEVTQYTKTPGPDNRYIHYINEIKIAGEIDKPKVHLCFDKLQYPVSQSALWAVQKPLSERYDLSAEEMAEIYGFDKIGSKRTVNWVVYFEDSEAKSKSGKPYKNVVDVIDLDLEDESMAQEPKPEPEEAGKKKPPKMRNGPEPTIDGWDSTKLWTWARKTLSPALIMVMEEQEVGKAVREAIAAHTDTDNNTGWKEVYNMLEAQFAEQLAIANKLPF